ncbi:hypothetical protein [Mucilaginibacter humi]|uniref:hypothetical protein n=1 Tax=Mucilaginibacter humi TaxID=2732510 RepID=UPI001FE35ECE|nr:hypothetical protein [Mucilaginibacter humi]
MQPDYSMNPIPVIAVFDVGKTNKKLFLFDESYNIVFERSASLMRSLTKTVSPARIWMR